MRGANPAVAQFLAHLTPRQIAIAAGYLDGFTEQQLANRHRVHRRTVIRDLAVVRSVCGRFDKTLPAPLRRLRAHGECQLSDDVYRSL